VADASSHARHDRFAIAAALDGSPPPSIVGTCPRCGALHRDLLLIQTAVRHAWTPRRPRDLRLARVDIARLRPPVWSRPLSAIGSSRDTITRPLAVGLTSLGVVGMVIGGTASAFGGATSSAAPAEYGIHVTDAPELPPIHAKATAEEPPTDQLLAVSIGSLVAGGGLFVIRRVARRARAVR
jgi:hypothetical protein